MNNQEILTKAIQKAIDNGWKPTWVHKTLIEQMKEGERYVSTYPIIFNHDFSKALWGEQIMGVSEHFKDAVSIENLGWQYHLQMMVIAGDPIKYLGEHL